MPTRLIREDLLDSERYWACTIEARQLFVHLMLVADDLGCFSAAPLRLMRRCFEDRPTPERLQTLLQQLADQDLIRLYEAKGAPYAFIPRFGQRVRVTSLKHPLPPPALYQDDEKAKSQFNKIKHLASEMTGICPSDDGHLSGRRPSDARHMPAEAKRSEAKRYSVPNGTGDPRGSPEKAGKGDPPPPPAAETPPPPDPGKVLFDTGVAILTRAHMSEPHARSIIAKIRKSMGDEATLLAIMSAGDKSDPAPYLVRCAEVAATMKEIEDKYGERPVRLKDGRFTVKGLFLNAKGEQTVGC